MEICLTPNEYRYYASAIIDRQSLSKDTTRLKSAISDLKYNIISLESDLERYRIMDDKTGQQIAIYEHKVDLLSDDVDKYKKKTIRNRRIAIISGAGVIIETVAWALFIYFSTTN